LPQTVAYVPSSVSGEVSNGHDPDGYDPADFEPPLLEAVSLHDFDPAHIDRSDFDETPAARSSGEDRSDATTGIPSPRPAEPPTRPAPAAHGTPTAAPLPVADLTASLRFYRDVLGGAVVDAGLNAVVIETVGTRVSLEQVTDPAALLPRRGAVHLRVADLEATCAKLVRHGVRLVQPPTPVAGDGSSGLWRARLHDPDGHEVELSQVRL
jgi:catechol 2,3-dioxygenase-like lactoylglutathione lyase family enzyme